MAEKRGGKLNKSEALQVRFDPILRWAVDILAGRERRSLSSTVEWATERAVKEMPVVEKNGKPVCVWQIADKCWHPDSLWRLVTFAQDYSELMTFDERNRYQAILFMVALEQKLDPAKEPHPICLVQPEWLPAMHEVWPYIVENSGNLDMVEVRDRYLKARDSCQQSA